MKKLYLATVRRIHGVTGRLGLVALALGGLAAPAQAGNGCEQLAQAVEYAVSRHLQPARFAASLPATSGSHAGDSFMSCGQTAAVTRAAFDRAASRFGITVDWSDDGPMHPGDHCYSHYLDQCYPDPVEAPFPFAPGEFGGLWLGVQSAIARNMPFGIASDLTWFRPSMLSAALGAGVDAALARRELYAP